MKKSRIIVLSAVLLIVFFLYASVTNWFTINAFTHHLYRVDNVYEEIWNLTAAEARGTETVLRSLSDDFYVDYDLGVFVCVSLDNGGITIGFEQNAEYKVMMRIFVKNGPNAADFVSFIYAYDTSILYGETDESFLTENLLADYFGAADNPSDYSLSDKGEYRFFAYELLYSENR
jgi:hypothetical protein